MTTTIPTRYQSMINDLVAYLRSRIPLIWINSGEEARVERAIFDAAAAKPEYDVNFWDVEQGITRLTGNGVEKVDANADPANCFARIRGAQKRMVWVLRDMHRWSTDPTTQRALRNLARELPERERGRAASMVIIAPNGDVPQELRGHTIVVEWPLPDREEITSILESTLSTLPEDSAAVRELTAAAKEQMINAALGLSYEQASNAYARSLVTKKRFDVVSVAIEKKRIISEAGAGMTWYDPLKRGLAAVGGLEGVKSWLKARESAFTEAARDFGLAVPKGVVVVGHSGCGKSLLCKAISTSWQMPLLKFDLGALKSKYVGDSEANLRKALKVAEAVAPCVLWVDEIEKAMAGATQGAADGGVSADALGTFLTWMQEKTAPVFVIATANDVSALPPELLRKGRFDEIFFVDLPHEGERAAILEASCIEHNRTVEGIDVEEIIGVTLDFNGAEVAALVETALTTAFNDGSRKLTTADFVAAARDTVPLSRTAAEKIKKLRDWAGEGRARPASTSPDKGIKKAKSGRKLDL